MIEVAAIEDLFLKSKALLQLQGFSQLSASLCSIWIVE